MRREAAGERGAEPAGAAPPPAEAVVPQPVPRQEAAPPVPPPPEDDEVLPDKELNLDGMVPPPLVKLHKRLARRSELLKLHLNLRLKHYHMSSAQFRRRTSEVYLPEGVYRLFDGVVKGCEVCQKAKPALPRSRFSGVRAKDFSDVVFMDHCEIKHVS